MSPDIPDLKPLLTDPDAFFAERSENPSLRGPLVVVTLIAFVGSLGVVVQNQALIDALRPGFESVLRNSSQNATQSDIDQQVDFLIQVTLVITYAFALVGPFVIWLLYGGVFHVISIVFGGEGAFSDTMAFVGWGRIPSLVGSVVTLAFNYYTYEISGVDLASDVDSENPFAAIGQVTPTEIVVTQSLVSIALTLWAAYIWVYAMKHARDLTRRQALITVSVPVLVSLLFTLNNLTSAL